MNSLTSTDRTAAAGRTGDWPTVSVIVPHLNDHQRLRLCLERLQRQTYPADLVEIIVVDNGSSRPIGPVVAEWANARAAFEAERGCGTARNRGVALSRGDVLAFTDSDCLPDPDWLRRAVGRLQAADGPDILGGEILIFCADEAHPTDAELYEKVFAFEQSRYIRHKHFAAGANILTTRRVFAQVGPFRNGKLPEDLEWGRRAAAKGFRLDYAPDAVVRHPARRSWEELRWKMDRTVFHQRNAMRERPLFLARWLVLMALLLVPPLNKLWQVARSPHLRPRQWPGAMRMVVRLRYYRVASMLAIQRDDRRLLREHYNG